MMCAVAVIGSFLTCTSLMLTDAIEAAKYSAYTGADTAPKCDADHASDGTAQHASQRPSDHGMPLNDITNS